MATITNFPMEHAALVIAKAVQSDIVAAIEEAIRAQIEPTIKALAVQKAKEVCERAAVRYERDLRTGSMNVYVSLNGVDHG